MSNYDSNGYTYIALLLFVGTYTYRTGFTLVENKTSKLINTFGFIWHFFPRIFIPIVDLLPGTAAAARPAPADLLLFHRLSTRKFKMLDLLHTLLENNFFVSGLR